MNLRLSTTSYTNWLKAALGIFAVAVFVLFASQAVVTKSALADELTPDQNSVPTEQTPPADEVTEPSVDAPAQEVVAPVEQPAPWVDNSDGSFTTSGPVELGTVYTFPGNNKVTVTFTSLPQNPGVITIREVILSAEEMEAIGAVSNIAYDITSSNMADGSFTYDLTLPLPAGTDASEISVTYAENRADLVTDGQTVSQEVAVVGNKVTIDELNHFTVFAVVKPPLILTCLLVPHTGLFSNCYSSLQTAINIAAPGDIIRIGNGTFTEQVVINKSLTIVGGVSLINPFAVSRIKAPNIVLGDGVGDKAIITVTNGATVNLSRVTVMGPSSGACESLHYGILVIGDATLNLSNSTVTAIRENPLSSCSGDPTAIRAGAKYRGETGHLNIIGNVIVDDYQKAGIVIDNAGSDASINDAIVTGAGQTSLLSQNGIQISRGATATVNNSTISGNRYTNPADLDFNEGSAGILVCQAGSGISITNTALTDNSIGLAIYDNDCASSEPDFVSGNSLVLDANTFLGNYRDIDNYDNDDLDAVSTLGWSDTTTDGIEALIRHDCTTSPYAHGVCNSEDYAGNFGSVDYVNASADLSVVIDSSLSTPSSGDTEVYTIKVTNNGPDTAYSVQISSLLPPGATFVSSNPGQGIYDENTGVWTVGNLSSGSQVVLEVMATVSGNNGDLITNIATATSLSSDPVAGNNSASTTSTITDGSGGGSSSGSSGSSSNPPSGGGTPPPSGGSGNGGTGPVSGPEGQLGGGNSTTGGGNGGNGGSGNGSGGSQAQGQNGQVLGASTDKPQVAQGDTNDQGKVEGDSTSNGNDNQNSDQKSGKGTGWWLWLLILLIILILLYLWWRNRDKGTGAGSGDSSGPAV
jgi:uncharacterized repeat protein (TIGR01451 family)